MGAKAPRIQMRIDKAAVPPTQLEVIRRVAQPLVLLLNPLVAGFYVVLLVVFVRQPWIRAWWLLAATSLALVGALLGGLFPMYLAPYMEVFRTIVAAEGGYAQIWPNVAQLAQERWMPWLIGQLPVAVIVAAFAASIVAVWRDLYKADWRKQDKPTPKPRLDAALRKMPQWPQKATGKPLSLTDLRIRLGVDRMSGKPFDLAALALGKHMYIDGPSGFGKTTDLIEILRGLVEAPAAQQFKIGASFITMKPDRDITDAMKAISKMAGRQLHIVTEDGLDATTTYNPLLYGTPEQIRNRVIEAEKNSADGGFSEPHYLRSGSRFTLLAARALTELAEGKDGKPFTYRRAGQTLPWRRDLPHLARIMNLEVLGEHTHRLGAQLQFDLQEYTAELNLDRDLAKGGSGIRQRLADASEGAAGRVLIERPDGLDLRKAIESGDLVLFNLDAAADAQAATYVANLALQDLTAAVAELGDRRWHKTNPKNRDEQTRLHWIVVDEFSALGGTLMADLFARSRSNGAGVCLATQESSALEADSPEFKDLVLTNSNVTILHAQKMNAEEHSKNIGTAKRMIETFQTFEENDLLGKRTSASGQGNLREGDAFKVHPNELKELEPGEVVILVNSPREQRRVKIRRSNPIGDAAKMSAEAQPKAEVQSKSRPQKLQGDVEPTAKRTAPVAPTVPATPAVTDKGDVQQAANEPAQDVWAVAAATAAAVPAVSAASPAHPSTEGYDDEGWMHHAPTEEEDAPHH